MTKIIRILIVAVVLLSAGNSEARRSSGTKDQPLGAIISDGGDSDSNAKNNQVLQQLQRMGVNLSQEQLEMLQSYDDGMLGGDGQQFIPMIDPTYEWGQCDSKTAKAILTDKGLLLESKLPNQLLTSTTELPFDPEDSSFEFGLSFLNTKPEEGKFLGFVFNYENNKNYEGLILSKKDYMYFIVEKGEISVYKQGLVKTGKNIYNILMKREPSKIEFFVNGVEITTLKGITLKNSKIGIIIQGKMSVLCDKFYFKIIEDNDESEESTSDV
ncbi:MAG: hypothetical protein K2L21_00695 [Muribaculaceae bacterium]|nr:hypothetical protein [Muribaculaceae bacterium]